MNLIYGFRDYINTGIIHQEVFDFICNIIPKYKVRHYKGFIKPFAEYEDVRTDIILDIFNHLYSSRKFAEFIFNETVNKGALIGYCKTTIKNLFKTKFKDINDINNLLYQRIKSVIKNNPEFQIKIIENKKCVVPIFLKKYVDEILIDIDYTRFYDICSKRIYNVKTNFKFDKNIIKTIIEDMFKETKSIMELNTIIGIIKKLALYPNQDYRYKLEDIDISFKPWDLKYGKEVKVSYEIEEEVMNYFKEKFTDMDIFITKCFFIHRLKQQDIMEKLIYGKGLKKSSCYNIINETIDTSRRIIDRFNLSPEYFKKIFELFLEN